MGFYWNYTLLLEPPVLMRSWALYDLVVHTPVSVQELVHMDIYCAGCDVFLGLRSLPYKVCPIFCVHHCSKLVIQLTFNQSLL